MSSSNGVVQNCGVLFLDQFGDLIGSDERVVQVCGHIVVSSASTLSLLQQIDKVSGPSALGDRQGFRMLPFGHQDALQRLVRSRLQLVQHHFVDAILNSLLAKLFQQLGRTIQLSLR